MSQEEKNKAVLQRFWEEVWDKGELDVVDEIFHEKFVDHGLAPGLTKQGPEGAKEAVMQFRNGIPDLYLKWHDMVAEGDKVLSLWEAGGTHTGPLKGGHGTIPPTGKKAVIYGFTLNRLEDGRIIDAWDNFDMMGMLQQLGIIPSGGGPPGAGPSGDGDSR